MLEHAKRAADAMPAGHAQTAKLSNFTARPTIDNNTVLSAVQKKAQMELSPTKSPNPARIEAQVAGHVGSDAMLVIMHKKFAEGAKDNNGVGYNDIMVKRLSVGTGGAKQQEADRLYTDTLRAAGLSPFSKEHIHLKLWAERAWQEHDDPAAQGTDIDAETGMAKPDLRSEGA